MGLMDEDREYYVVSEIDRGCLVKENEASNQNTAI